MIFTHILGIFKSFFQCRSPRFLPRKKEPFVFFISSFHKCNLQFYDCKKTLRIWVSPPSRNPCKKKAIPLGIVR